MTPTLFHGLKTFFLLPWMAPWSTSSSIAACGVVGREIESRQGTGWQLFKKENKTWLETTGSTKKQPTVPTLKSTKEFH
jgi:hypothetical protein